MEEILKGKTVWETLWPALLMVGIVVLTIMVIYGVDTVMPGIHDLFHDFRHSLGIACH